MVIFYKKCKKYYEIQLTKNKRDLNIQKITNHPPSPGHCILLNVDANINVVGYRWTSILLLLLLK